MARVSPSLRQLSLALTLMACTAAAGAAGTVEARLLGSERYADIGWTQADRIRHLETLMAHLQGLARQLPAGQRLAIDVLEVDLAGEEVPDGGKTVRVLRGRADWPRMHLRWQLSSPGQVGRAGEEWIADPVYLDRLPPPFVATTPLPYELRLLEEWFASRILRGEPGR